MANRQVYRSGLRVPVMQAPTVQRVDVSSGALKLAEERAQIADQLDKAHKATVLNDAQTGAAQGFRDLDERVRPLPWDQKSQAYEEGAANIRAQYLDGIDDQDVKAAFTGDFERMYGSYQVRTRDDAWKGQASHALAQADEANDGYARDMAFARTPQEKELAKVGLVKTWGNLRAGGFIDEAQERAGVAKAMASGDMYAARKLIDDDPWKAKKALEGRENFKWLGLEQVSALRSGADSEIRQREAQARAEARDQLRLSREIEKDRIDAEKKLTELTGALYRVGNGELFDPRSDRDRKDVDLVWGTKVETLAPEARVPAMVQFAGQVGMVPEQGKKLVRGLLRSARDEDVLQGVDLVGRLRTQNPELVNDFTREDTRLAESVLAQTDSGVAPQVALRRYREGLQMSDAMRDVRLAAFKDELKNSPRSGVSPLRTAVGGDSSWLPWEGAASVPPEAEEEFNRLRADEYLKTGSMDAATKFAADNIKRVYSVSELNGGRTVTKHAPEYWYGSKDLSISDNAAWIRDQARAEAGSVMGGAPEGDIQLSPARRVGADGRPAYVITITKPDGERVVPIRNGKPVLFVPSFETSPAKKKVEGALKAQIDSARADKREKIKGFKARDGILPGDFGL